MPVARKNQREKVKENKIKKMRTDVTSRCIYLDCSNGKKENIDSLEKYVKYEFREGLYATDAECFP